jgi:hypothetical protein
VIAHVVLFRPRAGLSDRERLELIDALSAALREIPSIRRAHVGPRVIHGRPYEQLMDVDYSFAAILEFENVAGVKAYLDHPAHERLATRFFACFERALMYDFELQEGEDGIASIREAKLR